MLKRPLSVVCLMIIVFLFMGTIAAGSGSSAYEALEGEQVAAVGRVYKKEYVPKADQVQKILYLQLISLEEELHDTVSGQEQNIICYLKSDQELPKTGSIVKVTGKLGNFRQASNPGQFDAKSYYHILKISFQLNQTEIQAKSESYSKIGEKLYEIREYFSDILENSLSQTDASIMKAMLLGEKGAADSEIKALYQRNGIAHILVISGLHISLLGMTLYKLLKRLGLPAGIRNGLPAVIIILYVFMTGFSVSSLRAVIMFVLHMAALLCRRTYDMITAAFLAAVLLLLDQPYYLYSSSFWFSFGYIFAIGFLVPALTKEMKGRGKQPGAFLTLFLSEAALTAAGIPLQLCFFYQVPLYSAILNPIVIPLMSFLLPGGMLLLSFHKIPVIKTAASCLITGILAICEGACQVADKLPFHVLLPGKPGMVRIGISLLLLLLAAALKNRTSLRKRWALLLIGTLILFLPGKKELTVTFLDVGQGDCIHIKTMEGKHYLIDGGSSSVSQVGTYRILPYLKWRGADEIEGLFITHPDEDHCNGILELMQQGRKQGIHIKKLYVPDIGEKSRTQAYENLVAQATENKIPVEYISKGQALLETELKLLCLHPEKGYQTDEANEFSTVLLLQFRDFQALLTGDAEGKGEEKLLQSLYEVKNGEFEGIALPEKGITVLKAAHHGSGKTTGEEMLKLLKPAYTVISCGENNSYGHPHQELLDRLTEQKTNILITYETGAVTFYTDGRKMQVEEFLESS